MMKLIYFAVLVLMGCQSGPTKSEEREAAPWTPPPPSTVGVTDSEIEHVDTEALERSLRLSRPLQELGYRESSFNSCQAGFGYSSSKNCRRLVMASINFRLQCRDSVDTISTALTAQDLVAIGGQGVRWTLQKQDGVVMTDGEGYGNVRGVFQRSPKNDWLRVAIGVQFLNMRASTITRVVTPRPWCHPD